MKSPEMPNGTESKAIGTHIPVMLKEMLATLGPRDGAVFLDGTFGGGGYSRAILSVPNAMSGPLTGMRRRSPAAPRSQRNIQSGCICCTEGSATC